MSIEAIERETYTTMWGFEQYGQHSPGETLVDLFLDMAGIGDGSRYSVLDAGCGSGKGALALQAKGFAVTMCDLTDSGLTSEAREIPFREACLWRPLRPQLGYLGLGRAVDYGYCCDVLEHIPTPLTMLVVSNVLEVCRVGAFFSIALRGDEYGAFVGHPLHRTVESFVFWRDHLRELGTVIECRDLGANGLYLVAPR